LGAVRTRGCLSDDLREIAICRPAIINRAWFEWDHHAPLLAASPGFTEEQFAVVKQLEPQAQGALTDKQWAVLCYSDAMTKNVAVPDDVFASLQTAGFSEREIVEITLTCAAYNMVSRFLVALDIGEANEKIPEALAAVLTQAMAARQ
jgi:alkylhydroperoxidase family enzyme